MIDFMAAVPACARAVDAAERVQAGAGVVESVI
jgi:hypothetical protein